MSGQLHQMLPAYGGQKPDCISRASRTFPRRATGPLIHMFRGSLDTSVVPKEPRNCCASAGALSLEGWVSLEPTDTQKDELISSSFVGASDTHSSLPQTPRISF